MFYVDPTNSATQLRYEYTVPDGRYKIPVFNSMEDLTDEDGSLSLDATINRACIYTEDKSLAQEAEYFHQKIVDPNYTPTKPDMRIVSRLLRIRKYGPHNGCIISTFYPDVYNDANGYTGGANNANYFYKWQVFLGDTPLARNLGFTTAQLITGTSTDNPTVSAAKIAELQQYRKIAGFSQNDLFPQEDKKNSTHEFLPTLTGVVPGYGITPIAGDIEYVIGPTSGTDTHSYYCKWFTGNGAIDLTSPHYLLVCISGIHRSHVLRSKTAVAWQEYFQVMNQNSTAIGIIPVDRSSGTIITWSTDNPITLPANNILNSIRVSLRYINGVAVDIPNFNWSCVLQANTST